MKCFECNMEFDAPTCPYCSTLTFQGRDENPTVPGIDIQVHFSSDSYAPAVLQDLENKNTFPVAFPICRIGRDQSNELMIAGDEGVSRVHCLICAEEGYFFVADAGSTNGTFLNGNQLIEKTPLRDGDNLQISGVKLRFVHDENAVAGEKASEPIQLFVELLHKRLGSESQGSVARPVNPTKEFDS